MEHLKSTWVNPRLLEESQCITLFGKRLDKEHTLYDLLKRPQTSYRDLACLKAAQGGASFVEPVSNLDPAVVQQLEIAAKYDGYIARQRIEIARHESHETTRIPQPFDYRAVRGLSIEVQQKLQARQPETLGQAARISGVTPAAISLLLVYLKRWSKERAGTPQGEPERPSEKAPPGSDNLDRSLSRGQEGPPADDQRQLAA